MLLSMKEPDAFVKVRGRKWPSIALETGYSEGGDELKDDADMLLAGSRGRLGIVITIKIDRLAPGDSGPQNGYVEVWTWDKQANCKKKLGKRQVRFF